MNEISHRESVTPGDIEIAQNGAFPPWQVFRARCATITCRGRWLTVHCEHDADLFHDFSSPVCMQRNRPRRDRKIARGDLGTRHQGRVPAGAADARPEISCSRILSSRTVLSANALTISGRFDLLGYAISKSISSRGSNGRIATAAAAVPMYS